MLVAQVVVLISQCNRLLFLINKMLSFQGQGKFYPNHTINFMKTNFHLNHVTLCNVADNRRNASANCAKHHINVCSGGDLYSPFISNFSETPCVKVGLNVRIPFV